MKEILYMVNEKVIKRLYQILDFIDGNKGQGFVSKSEFFDFLKELGYNEEESEQLENLLINEIKCISHLGSGAAKEIPGMQEYLEEKEEASGYSLRQGGKDFLEEYSPNLNMERLKKLLSK